MKPVHIFSDKEAMGEEIARNLYEQSKQAKARQLVFSIVLSGGKIGPLLYGMLALPKWRDRIPWESIHIFFADERCVPPDNEESNYKTVCDLFINHISIPETNIHRILGEESPEKESLRYAKEIQNHLALRNGDTNYFDWTFLGVGTDGHTASLFPNQNIINSKQLCEVTQHPETGQIRITMTPTAINKSTRVTYHVIGERKSEIVSEVMSNFSPHLIYPTSQIKGELFLDKQAASKIDFKELDKIGRFGFKSM